MINIRNKKLAIILAIILLISVGVVSGYYYLKNLRILPKDTIMQNYFSGAASGVMDNKKLSSEERKQLWIRSASELAKYTAANPMDADAFNRLAGAYYNTGEYDKAIKAYEQLISLEPDKAINYTNIAHVYLVAKNIELAKENYQKSIGMDPSLIVNYIQLFDIFSQEGNTTEAKAMLDKGLAQDPKNDILNSLIEK